MRILSNWRQSVAPLTKADRACLQIVDDAHKGLDEALSNPHNQQTEQSKADSSLDDSSPEPEYKISDWTSFAYCIFITLLVRPIAWHSVTHAFHLGQSCVLKRTKC